MNQTKCKRLNNDWEYRMEVTKRKETHPLIGEWNEIDNMIWLDHTWQWIMDFMIFQRIMIKLLLMILSYDKVKNFIELCVL